MSLLGDITGGLFGSTSGGSVPTQQAANLADPFASSRDQYGTQLNNLMAGGAQAQQTLQNLPGYQFQLQQGLGAINAQGAATGNMGAPGLQAQMTQYAEGLASSNYNTYFNQLAELSGAGWGASAGSTAGQMLLGGQNQSFQQGQTNVNSLGSLGAGLVSSGAAAGLGSMLSGIGGAIGDVAGLLSGAASIFSI